ncbi:hypothetical protein [Hymenobacter antarcticus]|uniref:Uncharacterized protein n=1 Tax=Hymenobacter antarcticus TaxID=486270 RepID=A0ABP7PCJ6_9BACT
MSENSCTTLFWTTAKNFTSFANAGDYKALLQQALEIKANPYGYQHIGRNKTTARFFHLTTRLPLKR